MTDIDTLRQRVEAAERAVGQYHSHDAEYSDRLIALFGGIEQRLLEQRDLLGQRDQRIKSLDHENRELRAMLHALLLAVEDGGRGRVGTAVGELEQRVSALVGGRPSAVRAAPAKPVAGAGPEAEAESDEGAAAAGLETGAPAAAEVAAPDGEAADLEAGDPGLESQTEPGPEPWPEPGPEPEPEAEALASSALDYGIEEEPDLAMPSGPGEATATVADPEAEPSAAEAPGEIVQDDEAARLRLINQLLEETDPPVRPEAQPEEPPEDAAEDAAEAPARSEADRDADDSVQQIIQRVSRLVSDLSEQEERAPPTRATSAA